MSLNADLAGKQYGPVSYTVRPEAIEKYARATNDLNERYLTSDAVAPPVFPIVPAFGLLMEATTDPELRADVLRLVHVAEEHVFHEAIRAGDVLTVLCMIESVEPEGEGGGFTITATERNQEDELVAEVRARMFIRRSGSTRRRTLASDDRPSDVVFEETTKVDDDQTYRYSEASGDHNPIHLDPDSAKKAGLRGIIVHGMCTMAMAAKGAVNGLAGGDPERLKKVSVRLSRPVRPGDELTTKFWEQDAGSGVMTYGFETYNQKGSSVIKPGRVDISR